MKVSLILLTYNRKETTQACLAHNLGAAGDGIYELIHVDNGSTDGSAKWMKPWLPDIQVIHCENLGVSRGYNRGYLLATGSHVLITGMDRLLPSGWLKTLVHYFAAIPNTGVISIYGPPIREGDVYTESRYHGPELVINGLPVQPAIPFEARICSREFFLKCGFLREDFDTYGYEDNEWGMRAGRVAQENGLINYIIPGLNAEHYQEAQDPDGQKYRAWKDSFLEGNRLRYEEIERQRFPYYNPYC